jgi:hypothetical protein
MLNPSQYVRKSVIMNVPYTEPTVARPRKNTGLPEFPCVRFPTDSHYESGWRPGARMRPKKLGAQNGHYRRRHFRGFWKYDRIHREHDQRLRAHQRRACSALRHRGARRPSGLAVYDCGADQRICSIRQGLFRDRRGKACASRLGARAAVGQLGSLSTPKQPFSLLNQVGPQLPRGNARDLGDLENLVVLNLSLIVFPANDGQPRHTQFLGQRVLRQLWCLRLPITAKRMNIGHAPFVTAAVTNCQAQM